MMATTPTPDLIEAVRADLSRGNLHGAVSLLFEAAFGPAPVPEPEPAPVDPQAARMAELEAEIARLRSGQL